MKGSGECAPGRRQRTCGLRSSAPGLPMWEVNRGHGGWKGSAHARLHQGRLCPGMGGSCLDVGVGLMLPG